MESSSILEKLKKDGWTVIPGIMGYHWHFKHLTKTGTVMVECSLDSFGRNHITSIEKASGVKLSCHLGTTLTLNMSKENR